MTEPTEPSSASYESKRDPATEADLVRQWIAQIEVAGKDEEDYRKDAKAATDLYSQGKDEGRQVSFNIFHSNIETIVPSLYNSTPVPDIRRRFGDADPVAKMGADILERTISQSLDMYDFDSTIRAGIRDLATVDRGLVREVYTPTEGEVGGAPDVVYQEIKCRHIQWDGWRHGPAHLWEDVPWVAFSHYVGRDELNRLSPEHGPKVKLDLNQKKGEDKKAPKPEYDSVFGRTLVWEIWDKDKREVLFIAPSYQDAILKVEPDPLGLRDFYPIPRPMTGAHITSSLTPVCSYTIYKDLLEELDVVTRRIKKLVAQLRPRGLGPAPADVEAWIKADDGEVVALKSFAQFLDTPGGIEKLIAWFPMEPTVRAVQTLYEQRNAIKQSIYEVTGLSDILRGASDAQETATAQQIKSQWGSVRIRDKQQEVQRFIRDLFRIKAEIICNKFTQKPELLAQITGFSMQQLAPADEARLQQMQQSGQPPPAEAPVPLFMQAIELLKNDAMVSYRIDIETDFTVRGDVARNMEQMTQFVQGSGAFFQGMAPAVESGAITLEVATLIYSSFARQLKLGRSVEEALDKLSETAKQPKPEKPDPEQVKAEMEKQKIAAQADAETKKLTAQEQSETRKFETIEKPRHNMEMALKGKDMEIKQAELELKRDIGNTELELKRETGQFDLALKQAMGEAGLEQQHQKGEIAQAQSDAKIAATGATPAKAGANGKGKAAPRPVPTGPLTDAISKLGQMLVQMQQAQLQSNQQIVKAITAPKTMTTPDGRTYTAQTRTMN